MRSGYRSDSLLMGNARSVLLDANDLEHACNSTLTTHAVVSRQLGMALLV